MPVVFAVAMVVSLLLGFAIGLMVYTRSRRWCGACGATLVCVECAGTPGRDVTIHEQAALSRRARGAS
jgi:hypothetical protein